MGIKSVQVLDDLHQARVRERVFVIELDAGEVAFQIDHIIILAIGRDEALIVFILLS